MPQQSEAKRKNVLEKNENAEKNGRGQGAESVTQCVCGTFLIAGHMSK